MNPRALRFRVMAMARPSRPPLERIAVFEAATIVRDETGLASSDPVAAVIAERVVVEMRAYLLEEMDPLLAAIGGLRRKAAYCPFATIATDPDMDSHCLFTETRVELLRTRHGRGLSAHDDAAECDRVWKEVACRLRGRFLRHLRD